jgi:hypothetical protein
MRFPHYQVYHYYTLSSLVYHLSKAPLYLYL